MSINIKKQIKAFADSYSNIHFLDFSNDIISLNEAYFYDTFHLNALGANEFSIKIASQINKLFN